VGFKLVTLVVIGTDCIGSCKCNYHTDISKHILIHEEPKHVCKVCGKAFRHIKNKELHLKRLVCFMFVHFYWSRRSNLYLEFGSNCSLFVWVRVMVFNATFNNISVISWQSVWLVEENGPVWPPVKQKEQFDLQSYKEEQFDLQSYTQRGTVWPPVMQREQFDFQSFKKEQFDPQSCKQNSLTSSHTKRTVWPPVVQREQFDLQSYKENSLISSWSNCSVCMTGGQTSLCMIEGQTVLFLWLEVRFFCLNDWRSNCSFLYDWRLN
jgi:hypothetical protein